MKKTIKILVATSVLFLGGGSAFASSDASMDNRPLQIINQMQDSALKQKLLSCAKQPITSSLFSIGHRGASLGYPEHTRASYEAAAKMGAGIVECDVTFTKDKQLVCRHSQNDLHATTNIVTTKLSAKCTAPFSPADGASKASAECRTSDLTFKEFKSLRGKMDGANKDATTSADYLNGMPKWRTNLATEQGSELLSHAESIELFKSLGVKFTPELKSPKVSMPYEEFSQENYAQKMLDEYKAAGVPPKDVWAQSFDLRDIQYWLKAEPEFAKQAVYLDGRYRDGIDPSNPSSFSPSMAELKSLGLNYIAPPLWMLVTLKDDKIVPSAYAIEAKKAGLKLITWTLERSGPLQKGGGWYYKSIKGAVKTDGAMYELLHVLAKDVGIAGIFSDWPATTTYYANCMGLK